MTNKEAIGALNHIRGAVRNGIPPTKPGKAIEGIDLAIAALERDSTYRRALYLLDATYRLLEKQVESRYVLNILETTVDYDDADCDGNCLMEDIEALFFEAEYHPEPPKEET